MALMLVPGIGQALGPLAMKIGLGMTVGTVVGMGLLVAGSMLMGPGIPKPKALNTTPTDRLHASLDPRAPRKMVFGITAMPKDMHFGAFTR